MDPLVVSAWGTAALIIIFQDPNVPEYIQLRLSLAALSLRGFGLRIRLGFGLALSRRSFRNDWLGRRLRDRELRSIQRNPSYRELFDNDHPSK